MCRYIGVKFANNSEPCFMKITRSRHRYRICYYLLLQKISAGASKKKQASQIFEPKGTEQGSHPKIFPQTIPRKEVRAYLVWTGGLPASFAWTLSQIWFRSGRSFAPPRFIWTEEIMVSRLPFWKGNLLVLDFEKEEEEEKKKQGREGGRKKNIQHWAQ